MKKAELELVRGAMRRIKDAGRMAVLVRTMPRGTHRVEFAVPEDCPSIGCLILGAVWIFDPPNTGGYEPIKAHLYYGYTRSDDAFDYLCAFSDAGFKSGPWYATWVKEHGELGWNPPAPGSIGTTEWFAPLGRKPTEGEIAAASALVSARNDLALFTAFDMAARN